MDVRARRSFLAAAAGGSELWAGVAAAARRPGPRLGQARVTVIEYASASLPALRALGRRRLAGLPAEVRGHGQDSLRVPRILPSRCRSGGGGVPGGPVRGKGKYFTVLDAVFADQPDL